MTTTMTDGGDAVPPFAVLAAKFCDPGDMPEVTVTSFADALATGSDPGKILTYLSGFALHPKSLTDLHTMINALEGEEELHAWVVAEGVAVSVASDNAWHLFTDGEVTP